MIGHNRVVAATGTLMCFGLTLVAIDSLSAGKRLLHRPQSVTIHSWKRKVDLHRCPLMKRQQIDKVSSTRLFSVSDFSSHPYSIYYGTSGSTARQNFGQNDDINDVYGYGPETRVREEPYDNADSRRLHSMQDDPLLGGRRGATLFGTKYDGGQHFYHDPRVVDDRERLFHDDRFMEDQFMMDELDVLLHERDHLRRKLDAVVRDNIHLQNQNNFNVGPQCVAPAQSQYCEENANAMSNSIKMEENKSTRAAVDSVMGELKNMKRTVYALESEHQHRNLNGDDGNSESPTMESIKIDLRNLEQELHNLDPEQTPSPTSMTNGFGYDISKSETSQPGYVNGNGSVSVENSQQNSENSMNPTIAESNKSTHDAQIFDGEYEVIIKAELKKKLGVEWNRDQKQTDVGRKESNMETFGSKYI